MQLNCNLAKDNVKPFGVTRPSLSSFPYPLFARGANGIERGWRCAVAAVSRIFSRPKWPFVNIYGLSLGPSMTLKPRRVSNCLAKEGGKKCA